MEIDEATVMELAPVVFEPVLASFSRWNLFIILTSIGPATRDDVPIEILGLVSIITLSLTLM